jgi:hypothetical protein
MFDPQEEALIRSFIDPWKRQRILRRLANPKTRRKQIDKFNHFYDLDERYAHLIPPREQTPEGIYRLLRERGAPATCHVMGNGDLDGLDLPLDEAINRVLDYPFGQFISRIPGKLAFFQDEDLGRRYILERQCNTCGQDRPHGNT